MKPLKNPFTTSGYESAEYFCDREQESENLIREVINGNNPGADLHAPYG